MKVKLLVSTLLLITLNGCSAYGTWFGETKPMMTFAGFYEKDTGNQTSKIFIWSPKNTAAILDKNGYGCVQGAEVFHNQGGELNASEALVGLLKGVDLSPNSTSDEKALAIKLANDIVALRTNSERATYLSIGLFGLCQLHVNRAISTNQMLDLLNKLFDSSIEVKSISTTGVAVPLAVPSQATPAPADS
ncbi:hypothetical protein [Allohahella sp. A8]|uniref:hypothetical protein n=1 Tax=Allohahella sp. A8 TaxID=3141461 RepID=UPI003A80A7F2